MASKTKKTTMKEYAVTRCWRIDMRSVSYVTASSVEEACELALDDDDYSDQEICDGSDGPTFIWMVEGVGDGKEYDVPEQYMEGGFDIVGEVE